ncbi:MAG: putative cytokinetic ring protein SteA [Actinomycetota bacterium]
MDARTKRLSQRVLPGEIAVIDHEDLDRVSAEALIAAGVGGVVNASRSISGRYPNLGPIRLLEAGIPLIDTVGPLLMRKVREGDAMRLDGDRIYAGDRLVAVGIRQSRATIRGSMDEAQLGLADRFESFARNTVDYMQRERDLLFGGAGLPVLEHDLANRPVLVVVRGTNHKEDLAVLRPYIRDVRPVLLGVDGGADALIEAGYTPDLILGDMDSVSDEALALTGGAPRRWFRRRLPTELVLHAYRDGHAPGRERLEALGVPFRVIEAAGTSEDVAFLLAHEKGAETIVAVGSHGNLREFLDKGREGMSSTFLVRLRVGEILMDAKGVSRVYSPRIRTRDGLLLVAAAMVAIAAVVAVSPPLRLYVSQLFEQFRQWLFDLKELL